jgi:hypothetical protein
MAFLLNIMVMPFTFKIFDESDLNTAIPLTQKFNDDNFPDSLMKQRFLEMVYQNYECAGIYDGDSLLGVLGMWF